MSYVCKTPFFKLFLMYHNNHHLKVDLRSDTVTKPSPAMRQAMANAEVLMMMQIHSDDNACSIMHILDTFHVYMKRLKGNHKKTFFFADSAAAEYCSTFLRVFVCHQYHLVWTHKGSTDIFPVLQNLTHMSINFWICCLL